MKKIFFFLVFIFLIHLLHSELIILNDDSKIIGKIVKSEENKITIKTEYGILEIVRLEIKGIYKNELDYKIKSYKEKNKVRKHFFDVCIMTGFSLVHSWPWYAYGGIIGLSIGYQYLFTRYFAFGPGLSGFGTIANYRTIEISRNNHSGDTDEKWTSGMTGLLSGGALMGNFMFGKIGETDTAFLLDIGGGWLFALKLGFYIRGLTVKFGYQSTFNSYGHNFTVDIGYKFNWAGNKK